MLILTLRTDKPEAELGLFEGNEQLAYVTWQAHRELAETLHTKIAEILKSQARNISQLQGLVAFKGPGSFTGLRISVSVANALADSLRIPIIASSEEDWAKQGISRLLAGENDQIALPDYGAEPRTTRPKH